MSNTKPNTKNLKSPFKKGEYTEAQKRGTAKSTAKAHNIKEIKEWAEENLFSTKGSDKTPLYEIIFKKLEQLCNQGSLKAIEMLLNYSGLKPIDEIKNETSLKGNLIINDLSKLDTKTLLQMAEKAELIVDDK